LFFGGGLELGFEARAQFGELVAEGLGVLLVALGLGGVWPRRASISAERRSSALGAR
jgi:hypothetical protein